MVEGRASYNPVTDPYPEPVQSFTFVGYFSGDARRKSQTGEWVLEIRVQPEFAETVTEVASQKSQQLLLFEVQSWEGEE